MERHAVIDETFAGLANPSMTFEMGRPDITENRPGTALVEEVKKFDAEGGFKKIAEDRDEARIRDEKADAEVIRTKPRHVDLGIVTRGSDEPSAEDALKD